MKLKEKGTYTVGTMIQIKQKTIGIKSIKNRVFFTGIIGAILIRFITPYINGSKGNAGQSLKHNEVN